MNTLEASSLFVALAGQERKVLRLLLSNRRIAAPIAAAAGLSIDHFSQDDHRLIFAGWQVACENDLALVPTLRLIRRALQADNLWDESVPAGSNGMLHSDCTLADLATHGMTEEEIEYAIGHGPETDPLQRAIARNVVALVDAANALAGRAA